MAQSSPIEPYEQADNPVADYRQQSRAFLVEGREYLADGDLHQASEKGWALPHGWPRPLRKLRAGHTKGTTNFSR